MRGAGQLTPTRWTLQGQYLSNQSPAATWRLALSYRVTDTAQVGLDYSPRTGDLGVIGNWRVLPETARRPALLVGVAADRFGTVRGQRAYFATVARTLSHKLEGGPTVSAYLGLLWSESQREFRVPFGAVLTLHDHWVLQPLYDGNDLHWLVSYQWEQQAVTAILVRGEDPGIAYRVGW